MTKYFPLGGINRPYVRLSGEDIVAAVGGSGLFQRIGKDKNWKAIRNNAEKISNLINENKGSMKKI